MVRKRIKKISKIKFLLITFIFLLLITVAFFLVFGGAWMFFSKKVIGKAFAPRKIILSINEVYSMPARKELNSFVQSYDFSDFDISFFYKELKKNFKFIKKVESNFSNPDFAHLKLVGVIPLYLVNDEWILGNKRRLFRKELFSELNLENLRDVFIKEQYLGNKLDNVVYDFLQKVCNFKHWDNYRVTYFDFSNIELSPKDLKLNYLLRMNVHNFFDSKKYDFIDLAFDCLENEEIRQLKGSRQHKIIYDLRFKDRIYVKASNDRFITNIKGGGGDVG